VHLLLFTIDIEISLLGILNLVARVTTPFAAINSYIEESRETLSLFILLDSLKLIPAVDNYMEVIPWHN
jgi:hypothetical protein